MRETSDVAGAWAGGALEFLCPDVCVVHHAIQSVTPAMLQSRLGMQVALGDPRPVVPVSGDRRIWWVLDLSLPR